MKLPRISKNFLRYLLAPLLLVVLLWAIAEELLSQQRLPLLVEGLQSAISGATSAKGIFLLIMLLILMIANWSLEAFKWKLAISVLEPVSFFTAFKATFSGISFSVSLPYRVGEYLGRMLYLEQTKRFKAIPITVVASLSQLLVTVFAGFLSYLYLLPQLDSLQLFSGTPFVFFGVGIALLLTLFSFIFFKVGSLSSYLAAKVPIKWISTWTEGLTYFTRPHLRRLLLFSTLRYLVFLLQYACAFTLFNVCLSPLDLIAAVGFCFLLLSIVPNFAIAELGIRGLVSLWIVGLFSVNKTGILLATLTIWLVNLILPAVVGALLLLGIGKLYARQHEKN
ncbi:MAG: lysylphosphatidylglycerol synthase domain-containing protein [Chitinophagaceae bacterium]